MTSTRDAALSTGSAEQTEQLRQVLVALMVNDIQIAMRLDAAAPIGVQTPALVDVLNTRLAELGQQRLSVRPTDTKMARGRWALCWVDGTPLKPKRSLTDQGVFDGATLWLRFIDDTETRIPVIEHVTSAIPAELRKHWPSMTPALAARVGVVLVAVAIVLVLALLAAVALRARRLACEHGRRCVRRGSGDRCGRDRHPVVAPPPGRGRSAQRRPRTRRDDQPLRCSLLTPCCCWPQRRRRSQRRLPCPAH